MNHQTCIFDLVISQRSLINLQQFIFRDVKDFLQSERVTLKTSFYLLSVIPILYFVVNFFLTLILLVSVRNSNLILILLSLEIRLINCIFCFYPSVWLVLKVSKKQLAVKLNSIKRHRFIVKLYVFL